ncbi:MAG TPA: hypothetical protein DDZ88_25435 [Verrucomicrobiales bacterium]|nr:hypothetical protein [Verrucomicrobiales bacterium]
MPDNYESRLAEWKTKHGYRDLDPDAEEEEALRAADKQLKGDDYCVLCGKGPQPISGMVLITYRDDPYLQPDYGASDEPCPPDERVRACPQCWAAERSEESNDESETRLRSES